MSHRFIRRASVLLVAAVVIAALPVVVSAAEPVREAPAVQSLDARVAQSEYLVRIRSIHFPDRCLVSQVPPQATTAFTYTCGNFADQVWRLLDVPSGDLQLQNVASGLCLVAQGNPTSGLPFAYTCIAQFADQHWWLDYNVTRGAYRIRNVHGGGCLYATDWYVRADSCDTGSAGLWYISATAG